MQRQGLAACLAAVIAAAAAACGGNPTTPTPVVITPPTPPPTISCPADVTKTTPDGGPVAVSYTAPTVDGGAAPVTTACSTASGSTFPIGTTEVRCTATDGEKRQASCSFSVNVVNPAHISKKKFLAFGDSITQGVVHAAGDCLVAPSGALAPLNPFQFGPYVNAATPYPLGLQQLLQSTYPAEMPTVVNSGVAGEMVAQGDERLPGVLRSVHPDVLLLLEGVNDINAHQEDGVSDIEGGLRSMIRHAHENGVSEVLLSTLLPERVGGCRAYDWGDGVDDISDANDVINYLAGTEGATLVDMHKAFSGQEGTLLGPDGLHPNDAGYAKMAQVFFDAIKSKYQLP
jgi:lysophospholipase L1-like esterase